MTASQQVWRIGKETGREGQKKESAILMMSFSPWEEEETYAASRGAGAGLCMHMFTAFFFTHSDWVNCRCLSSFWNVNICCHLPWLT